MPSPFFRRGSGAKIMWAPAVVGTSPTRAEITAAADVTPQLNGVNGVKLNNAPIAAPNMAERFTPQIDGPDNVDTSTLVLLDDTASSTLRTAMAKGSVGALLLFPYGDVPTKRMEVWRGKTTGVNDEWTVGDEPARVEIGLIFTQTPTQTAVVPA